MGVFKSYDIRGIFGKEWDGSTARSIGEHLPGLLEARRIGVGRDVRLSSDEVFRELASGITSAGCDVADIGLCDTPAVYFATAFYDLDGSVMVTASHNPPEYNGMKVSGKEAVPRRLRHGTRESGADGLPGAPASPGARKTGIRAPA